MIILKYENITEIVSYMLNFEHNYTVFEPNGEPSTDVKKFPLLTLPNGYTVHYKPTCGIIYYNKEKIPDNKNEIIYSKKCETLIEKIYEQISKHEDHLLKERVTAVTGSCAIKHNKFVNGTYMIKSKNPFLRTKKNIDKFPARALILLSNNLYYDYNMPPHYSARASFTWYFMPMQFDSYIKNMADANALITSIYIDFEHFTNFPHNTITYNLKYSINFITIKLENKFIITEIGNMQYEMRSCDKIFDILNFLYYDTIKNNRIKCFDDIHYINDEKKCNSCDTMNIPFCIAMSAEENENAGAKADVGENEYLYYIFCSDCWNFITESGCIPKIYYYIIPLYNKYTIIEIFPKIYSISKEDFYKITPIENHHYVDAYNKILITNGDLKYVFETITDNLLEYFIVSFSGAMVF